MRDLQLKREDARGTGEDRQLKRIQEIKHGTILKVRQKLPSAEDYIVY
jgi:hypothetical protein